MIAAVLAVCAPVASAATVPLGSRTFNEACNAAAAGDTVTVPAGSYSSQTLSCQKAVTFVGAGVSTQVNYLNFSSANGPVVTNMRFITGLMSAGSRNVAVKHSTINNQTYLENTQGMLFDHIMWEPATPGQVWDNGDIVDIFPDRNNVPNRNITIQDSVLHGLRSPSATAHSDAIQLYNNGQPHTGIKILRNRFYDNECINLRTNPGDEVTLENNVFGDSYKGVSGCGWYAIDVGYANVTARYNVFPGSQQIQQTPTTSGIAQTWVGNAGAGFSAGCGAGGASGATMVRNVWTGMKCGTTDKQVSALKANSDGTLQTGSPLIDAGDTTNYPSMDFQGNARFAGLAPDAGAVESGAVGGGTPDTTPPETTITAPPASGASTSASIAFTASEAGSSFECQLDAGAYATCTSPKAYTGLTVGSHTFNVRATDGAGNLDPTPATATWTINAPADTTPPNTTITSAPTDGTATSASIAFTASEAGSTFECQLDTGAYATCTSPKAYTGLTVGSHTFNVRATDGAGNLDPTPATATWTISAPADTTPPNTTITTAPSNGESTSASIAFTASEAGSTFECQLDTGAYAACTSPKAYTGLTVGSHTFNVRATDGAGNLDPTPATATWTVNAPTPADTTAPTATITAKPASGTGDTSASFAFSGSDNATPAGSLTFRCKLDTAAYAACTSPKAYTGLAYGSHTFSVRATDAAGNQSTAATATWTIQAPDTTKPAVTITSKPSAVLPSLSTSATFAFSGSDDRTPVGSLTYRCALDGAPAQACVSPTTVTGLGLGLHTFTVVAVDAAGNASSPATATWSVVAVDAGNNGNGGGQGSNNGKGNNKTTSTTEPAPAVTTTTTTTEPALVAPTVTLLKPTTGTRFRETLKATAAATDDSTVHHVEFWLDSKRFGYDTTAPYAASMATGKVKPGAHTLVTRAVDDQRLAAALGTAIERVTGANTASGGKLVQAASTTTETATTLLATAPKGAKVRVGLAACGDAKANVVKKVTVGVGPSGHGGTTVPTGRLCVASVALRK